MVLGYCLLWALICRALFPRVLRALNSRIVIFGVYSVPFNELDGNQYCDVRTWKDDALLEVCVHVEPSGRRLPERKLAGLSRVVSSLPTSQLPI